MQHFLTATQSYWSRRASQDVSLMSRSVDNLAVPVRRTIMRPSATAVRRDQKELAVVHNTGFLSGNSISFDTVYQLILYLTGYGSALTSNVS
ncbi:unnamed protein product [Ceratitis capitata]|uniref:(Mediterranean fruit fly) hypothetical protein n=1 Tax=Ceratitis capitata TaxID=7213 RepID=A0A811TX20_CERCA|nr:unnamed protein product [Ceratitis capitata]